MIIADKKEPLALAGVIGGKNSEIGDHTTDIILETAYFELHQFVTLLKI